MQNHHNNDKIQEILTKNNVSLRYYPDGLYQVDMMKEYADYIREKTIKECMECVPEEKDVECKIECPFCDRGLYSKCNAYAEEKEYNEGLRDCARAMEKLLDNPQ